MKDNIQIALLVLIAGMVGYQTFGGDTRSSSASSNSTAAKPMQASTPPPVQTAIQTPPKSFDPMAQQNATPVDNKAKTTMNFAVYEHDFGNIPQDSENKYVFRFTNTGKEPLLIESATGSCGCTVPSYPKNPIAPGTEGQIEVVYKPGKQENQQQKTVTVVANTEPQQTILRIKANVQKVG